MSHFAQIDENDIVVNVIVAEKNVIESGDFGDPNFFIETDPFTRHNVHYGQNNEPDGGTPFRGNFASIGQKYDRVNDVFYPFKMFPSWILNQSSWTWEPPVPKPPRSEIYANVWNEETLSWDQVPR